MIVIGHDGSPHGRLPIAAIDTPVPGAEPAAISLEEQRLMHGTPEDGTARACAAGLGARPALERAASAGKVARTLVAVAAERDARVLVVGRRGMSRFKAVLTASLSTEALRRGRCPVLVVPGCDGD